LIVFAALSGCEYPTEPPIFDVRWVFSVEETSISVVELLPNNVIVVGGNFEVVPDVVVTQTLLDLCGAVCNAADGFTVPKPPFTLAFGQAGTLPTDVVSVDLVGGPVSLAIQNGLGFDPINPASGITGTMTVTLYDVDINGTKLGEVVWDGANGEGLPAGLTTIPITLVAGTVSSTIFTEVSLVSPAGDPVLVDITSSLTITVGTVSVSSATIDVDGLSVNLDPTDLDVEDIDISITDRIQGGSLILDIQNPFGVGVILTLNISGPGFTTISKGLTISSAGTSSVTITFTVEEFQRFLGQPNVQISGVGTVVSGVPAIVTPTQELVIEASLDIVLEGGCVSEVNNQCGDAQ
jgi:hypothetical protein